jgi:hypothetical protein
MNENEKAEQQYIDFEPIEYAPIFELEEYLIDLDNVEPIDILKVGHTPGKEPNANSQDATSDSDLGGPSAAIMGGSLYTADARPSVLIPFC